MQSFLELPGAVADPVGVASHYGEPLPEQRALERGAAIVDLSHRGIVTVSGPDRLSWLHSMTSQQLTGLRPGESTETLLLDPNGRIERAMRVVDDGERSWLLVDEGSSEPLAAFLQRMRFALRVEVHDVSNEYAAVLAFTGAGPAAEALRGLTPAVEWQDPWAAVTGGGVQYAAPEGHAAEGWSVSQFVFARAQPPGLISRPSGASGEVRAAGLLSLEALEVRAWRPAQHADVDERAIPHEFDWLRTAVHLTKGCYRGQETVAKVHNLGHPPRRLAMLHLDGSGGELPTPGALVFRAPQPEQDRDPEARPVGRITRAALHHEWGGIALALLKRALPEDAPLEVELPDTAERAAAAQEPIVPADAGATRHIPRLKRL
jgi:folate-binding protein YgfZ